MTFSARRYIDGKEVLIGQRWHHPAHIPSPSITIEVECVTVNPERYVAVIKQGNDELVRTEPQSTSDRALSTARGVIAASIDHIYKSAIHFVTQNGHSK